MPMIAPETGKVFEKPAQGKHIATVIDVVDLGIVTPKNPNPAFPSAPVRRVQIWWQLGTLGKDGQPIQHTEAPPFKVGEGSGKFKPTRLYEIATGVFQGPIPRPFDVESLIGKSNEIFIIKNGERTEIAGFLPVPPGVIPPSAPAGFVRKVYRVPKDQTVQTQPTQTQSQAQSQPLPQAQPYQQPQAQPYQYQQPQYQNQQNQPQEQAPSSHQYQQSQTQTSAPASTQPKEVAF